MTVYIGIKYRTPGKCFHSMYRMYCSSKGCSFSKRACRSCLKDDGSESHLSRTTRLFFVKRVVATGTRQGCICVSESSRYQQFLFIVPSARKTVTCQSVEDSLSTLGVDKFIHIIWREWQAIAGHLNFLYDSCTIGRKQSRHIISWLDSCLLLSQSKHLWYSSVSSIRA